jgi:two-component system, NtrC family, sensor kinase
MRTRVFSTLQGKFTLYVTMLIIAMMSGLAYWTISREKQMMSDAVVREGRALVEAFAVTCTNTMLYEEIGLVEEGGLLDNYISDLMQRKDLKVAYAMILDPKGKVIAYNTIKETGNVYQDAVTVRTLNSWATLVQDASPALLDISAPLAISTKRWGTLRIGISTEDLDREVSKLILQFSLYTLGFILLTVTVIALLFGLITQPLKSLSKEMDTMRGRAKLPALSAERADEIGILRKSFYGMLKRINQDEKERERTQQGLLLTEKMVAVGKLTSGVAHEINNPLGGILNCIYHFKKGISSVEKQREYLNLMEDGIHRIQKTVANLLEYARNPNPQRSPAGVGSLVERTLSLLEYQIRKNRISIVQEISDKVPPIHVDKDQMGQVLVNIFLNSIQAMEKGGTLTVKAGNTDEKVVITISDTGNGIPRENLPKVFDPFFTTKGAGTGTGLGLWISEGIIERHRGTIQITSEEARGTTVQIELPLDSK